MPSNELKLTILHKGLILLLVPFILQALLFLMLFSQIAAAEELAQKQSIRAEVLEKSSALIEDFGFALSSIVTQVFGMKQAITARPIEADEYITNVTRNLNTLKAIPQTSPRMRRLFTNAEAVCRSQYRILKHVEDRKAGQSPTVDSMQNALFDLYALKPDLAKMFSQTFVMRQEIAAERLEVHQYSELAKQKREQVKQLSIIFLLSELLLTGALLMYFLKNITTRLNSLVGNARRLPEDSPMLTRVKGNDEIAYLDSVLHEASEKLLEAKQNRQSIMNMIAHDIRSPLMSSNLLIDLLNGRAKASGDQLSVENAERLKQTYKKVILLVEDLLLLEKSDAKLKLVPQVVNMRDLCQSAVETVMPQGESKKITIRNEVESCELIADQMRIEQVLNNLLSNAIKFSSAGGSISVLSERSDKFLTISVKDEGAGIKTDDLARIFEQFYQSTSVAAGEGFGLGLAISKMIIDSHDGKIGVRSEIGKGSTFWFSLPLED